ncbi:hypothetical protein BFS06_13790 [Clostridium perfringens]|uniref:peptidyl-tRNA hydrolase n=1 Tax=Clostridium perfringens TaxID=1502 RepID=A0A140GRR3_CLOPF|nr:aminoacyl-tRNA hydrolase [Clostridium perfringens]AMN31222.1 putative peptidyl-tRNA hydrolase [Clostridium perfringens]TBX14277.1 hypothetical protein BFS06_13790 [Clostridium perfringens]
MQDYVMYILINKEIDTKDGKLIGKISGQVGHAVESYLMKMFKENNLDIIEKHMANDQKKVLLGCSLAKLEELEKEGFVAIRDNGLTDLPPKTLTCVNIGVINKADAPKFVKRLRLYRG